MTAPLLQFRAAGHTWALPVDAVAGVHEVPPIAPLPGQSAAVLGLASLQGRALLVIDLERLLDAAATGGAARRPSGPPPLLLQLDAAAAGAALLVEPGPDLRSAAAASPLPPPAAWARLCAHGTRDAAGETIGVLDPTRLLAAVAAARPGGDAAGPR